MKKLGGFLVLGCLAASLIAGPAYAGTRQATPAPSPAETLALCSAFFAADRCDSLEAEWADAVASGDRAQVKQFARAVLADAGITQRSVAKRPPECRDIFSETVCGTAEAAGAEVRRVLDNGPVYYIDFVRATIVRITDNVVECLTDLATCIGVVPLGPAQGRSGGDDAACTLIFSERVCEQLEPANLITTVYNIVRCYLDPACFPIPDVGLCTEYFCLVT